MNLRFIALFAVLLIAVNVSAQTGFVRDKYAEARIVSSASPVAPGDSVTLALELRIDPTWHTYWINPGEAGFVTSIDLALPRGWTASELRFPVPKKFVTDFSPEYRVAGYGFEGNVFHPFTVTVPEDARPGSTATLSGKVSWLTCDPSSCVPGSVDVSIDIPIAEQSQSTPQAESIAAADEKVPQAVDWPVSVALDDGTLVVETTLPAETELPEGMITFYPETKQVFDELAEPEITRGGRSLRVEVPKGAALEAEPASFAGVLAVETGEGKVAYRISTDGVPGPSDSSSENPGSSEGEPVVIGGEASEGPFGGGLFGMLLAAFLGGIILNIMPCVFPVISLKVMSFIGQAGEDKKKIFAHSSIFALGILVFFWILTLGLFIVRAVSGGDVGWGVQLQQPAFVLGLIFVMVAVALSLFGMVEFGTSLQGVGGNLANASGYMGSFWSGALAVLLATPCTAPLMAPAIGFALTQSAPLMFLVFTTLALGLAFPYLLLAIFPGLLNKMPPPGQWMETFKQFMGFPMLAVAVWLTGVIASQLETSGLQWALAAVLFLALSFWILGRFGGFESKPGTRKAARVAALAVFASSIGLAVYATGQRAEIGGPDIAEVIAEKRSDGKNVFVDFTAEWCVNCKINKRVAINTAKVKEAFEENDIELVTADWTNEDPRITKILQEFGRAGVPLYLLYPADSNQPAIQLPDGLITQGHILEAIEKLPGE